MAGVEFVQFGQLPAVRLCAPDGAHATVTMFGAHVVSWIPASGAEQLFCSPNSSRDGSKAIRGGVPIIFPQFAARGDGMRHGFARMSEWRLSKSGIDGEAGFAEFSLSSEDPLPEQWPHAFSLAFRIEIQGGEMTLSLRVRNCGRTPFSFATALHTYFAIDDIAATAISGLQHVHFWDDSMARDQRATQNEALLTCTDMCDRIYYQVPAELVLSCAAKRLLLQQDGFVDTVVWNPGAETSAALGDIGAGVFRQFICVEAAHIDGVELAPGAEWMGHQKMRDAGVKE